jgi:ketosteroid isomerase-like protein
MLRTLLLSALLLIQAPSAFAAEVATPHTNPRGERLTRADRIANVRSGHTSLDSLSHVPEEEHIKVYGNVAVYTTLLSIQGRYSGQAQQGAYRGLVVWVRRDGRWQQVASQLSPVLGR